MFESKIHFKPRVTRVQPGISVDFTQEPTDGIPVQRYEDYLPYIEGSDFSPVVIVLEEAETNLHGK